MHDGNGLTWEREYHERVDPHRRGARASDVILGAQDGLVNVLGVVLGVAAATGETKVALAAGTAAAIAESASMAAVAFTSTRAQAHYFEAERERERRHIQKAPGIEREEVRALYVKKGFRGPLLDRIVDRITSDPDVWVAVMMDEEHHLAPVPMRHSLISVATVGIASLGGSLLPLIPFTVVSMVWAPFLSVVTAGATLFAIGAFKARATVGSAWREGLILMAIGLLTAALGWMTGALFKVTMF